jgi:hypothetical protein
MSIYGDLSKPQRALLAALFERISGKSAVSIDTALRLEGKSRQTARNLEARGLVKVTGKHEWPCRVWLTPAGSEVMGSLDFRHSHPRR